MTSGHFIAQAIACWKCRAEGKKKSVGGTVTSCPTRWLAYRMTWRWAKPRCAIFLWRNGGGGDRGYGGGGP